MFLPLWAQQPASLLWRLLKITHYCNGQAHIFLTIMSILFKGLAFGGAISY